MALISGGDPTEPWGSSLRVWSGESPSLLLSSSKANASADLEKLTSVPEQEKNRDGTRSSESQRAVFENTTKRCLSLC